MGFYFFRAIGLTMVLVVVAPDNFAIPADASVPRVPVSLARPALFERNDGQYVADVAFRAAFAQVDAAIHADGSFTVRSAPAQSGVAAPIRFTLRGASKAVSPSAGQTQAYRTSYFRGGERPMQVTDVPHFARVQFDEVYPRIALAYYPSNGKLEYDFVVLPGGDLKQIAWRVSGAQVLKVTKEGDLVVQSAAGEYVQRKPRAYQTIAGEVQPVEAGFRVAAGGIVGFVVGPHDRNEMLVIDPVIEYASYLGGAGDDSPRAVTLGADGFIYVTGTTSSSDFPTAGAYSTRLGGSSDAFVTKINPTTGALVYSTYLGDARNADDGMGIAVDSAGSAYITGQAGTKFPTTTGAFVTSSSAKSGFLTKLSPAGNTLAYSSLIPGSQPRAIAIDVQGRAAITGRAGSSYIASSGAFQTTTRGDNASFGLRDLTIEGDAFALLMNANGGAPVFSTFYGGEGYDEAGGIAVDTVGNVWIGGVTESSDIVMKDAFQPTRASARDAFVAVLSSTGQLVASSFIGGSQNETQISGLAADPFGNMVMAGVTESNNFPTANAILSGGSLVPIYLYTSKGFVAKFALSPLRVTFATFLGSNANGGDWISGVTVDRAGDIHVVGQMSADVMARFIPVSAFMGRLTITSRYTNGDATFAMGISRDGQTKHYATLLAPCGEAKGCSDPVIGSGLAGEVVVAGSTYADWVPIAAANTKAKIAGKLPYPQDGFLMTLDLHRPHLLLTAGNSISTNGQPVTFKATSYGPAVSGTVTFADGATTLGTAPLIEGVATLSAPLSTGIRTLRATLGSTQSPALYLPVAQASGMCQ